MKKFLCVLASVALASAISLTGCSFQGTNGIDGRDGKDGQSVTIDDIYNKYVSEHGETSFEDFLKEYLSYDGGEIANSASLRAVINKSLMSGVSILTRFGYSGSLYPGRTSYKVYTGSGAILWMDKFGRRRLRRDKLPRHLRRYVGQYLFKRYKTVSLRAGYGRCKLSACR